MKHMIPSDISVSTDKNKLDIDYIHQFLSNTYWAKGIPKGAVEKSIAHSFCFGIYHADKQIGFARVITDFTTFAYLADVFIDQNQRGRGFSKILMDEILYHEELKDLRRWHLLTDDAQALYEKYGFVNLVNPAKHMERQKKPNYSNA